MESIVDKYKTGVFYGQNKEDYEKHFDPEAYYSGYHSILQPGSFPEKLMKDFHLIFSKVTPTGPRLLDVGTGPSIHSVISASSIYSEIYLSDYSSTCRESIERWIRKSPDTNDWSQHLQYVAKLERKSVVDLEERVRTSIKEVIFCDISAESMLAESFGKFDAITTSAALEAASFDVITYNRNVRKLYDLLNPGGHVAAFGFTDDEGVTCPRPYAVGEKIFGGLTLRKDDVIQAYTDAGFIEVTFNPMAFTEELRHQYGGEKTCAGAFSISAKRKA